MIELSSTELALIKLKEQQKLEGRGRSQGRIHKKLPPKKEDLSQRFAGANLTPMQRECLSLRYEYDLPIAEIARRKDRHRSTIQEHLHWAIKKLQIAARQGKRGPRE
ncbi:MAG TPA: sigma factor-like helix-turn-helix DNA-binding protein [Candidatus Solibacter sp.]|nr:sigma factor-like helix-turn-helix DNA-binding protein [Candidatus Solibacter sp.]